MSLATPTTQELRDAIVAQVGAAVSQAIPLFPKAFLRVLATVLAGVAILLYKYIGWVHLQQFVAYASDKETEVNGRRIRPLVEWGRQFGVGDPEPATCAELVITVTVHNQVGILAAGVQLLRADTGVLYLVVAPVALDGSTVAVTVRASSDQEGDGGSGALGNLEVGDVITFANPLPNVAPEAVVASIAVAGADGETTEQYRARVLRRSQRKPQGGAYADYQLWAEEVPGVANAYPYTGLPGEVDVYVEANTDLGNEDGIPDQTLLDAVTAAIELDVDGLATRRSANAAVNVLPIQRIEFDAVVGGLSPDEPATRDAIEAALKEYFLAREPYIEGLQPLPRGNSITQGAIGGVVNAIASAEGCTVANVALQLTSATIDAHLLSAGQKAKLGTVSYV